MIKLTIGNSECSIEGLDRQQDKDLRNLLSYTPDPSTAFFSGGFVRKQCLMDKRGNFPTGLLYLVYEFLQGVKFSKKDLRTRPDSSLMDFPMKLTHEPYPEQKSAAEACYKHSRGIVTAPTGTGKSVIAALIIGRLKVRTLVVVPSLELKRQLRETLSATFPTVNVGGLDDSADIAVENVDSLDAGEELHSYDCVIIDEFHHSGAKTYRKLNKKAWKNIYYKFGLTATPFRSQENERLLLESVLSKVIYRVDYQKAVKNGYIVPMEAYYYDLPKRDVEGYTWQQVYKELIVNNELRNRIIAELLKLLASSKMSTLCLVKEIQHGDNIASLTGCGFANGLNEDTQMLIAGFNKAKLTVLVGTTGVIGEGVDTKPAEFIIIAGLGKSKNAFMQQVGRGFRVYPGKQSCKIILFRDPSHKWTIAHFKAQVKYLRDEYGIEPVKLPLPSELDKSGKV
jgi:superfamily II DNA or RNA helicase